MVVPVSSSHVRSAGTNRPASPSASGIISLVCLVCVPFLACSHRSAPPPLPPAPPVIESFTASTQSIVQGAAVVLQWQVSGADSLTLDPLPGAIAGEVIQLSPSATTTYCLAAHNAGGDDSACVSVDVVTPTAAPPDPATVNTMIVAGGGVLLMWSPVDQASGYSIERTNGFGGTSFQPLATVAGDRYWFADGTTQGNSFYTFRVRATNSLGASGGVDVSSISAPAPPEGPPGPTVTPLDGTTVAPGAMLRFMVTPGATWVLPEGSGSGSMTADGVYTAPAQTGPVLIAAVGNGTKLFFVIVE